MARHSIVPNETIGEVLLTLSNELMMVIQLFLQLFVSVIFLVNMCSVSFMTFVLVKYGIGHISFGC